jgi:hypothetical protein
LYETRQEDTDRGNGFESSSVEPRYEHLSQYARHCLGKVQFAAVEFMAFTISSYRSDALSLGGPR